MTKIKPPSPMPPSAEESSSSVSEKETAHGAHSRDDSAVDGLEKQVRPSLDQGPVPETGGLKQPAGSSKSGAGKVAPEPAEENMDVFQTLEFPSAGRLMDSLYSMASWALGKKFRPGRSIDLMPHFTPQEHEKLKDIAGVVKQLKEVRRYPFMAHLMGTGGEIDVSLSSGLSTEVRLEGLLRSESKRYLSRVFHEVTGLTRSLLAAGGSEGHGTVSQWDKVLETISECWQWDNDLRDLRFRVLDELRDEEFPSELEVVTTGWQDPKGHAVGFVYAREEGERYIYACNTGGERDRNRTIVKYSISDESLFRSFLWKGDEESYRVKDLWTVGPEVLGLSRCPEEDQIPLAIERASQKRGNCPVASRKSCQLAMMWSQGKKHGLSPHEIKTLYKVVTTLIRCVGVQAALAEENPEFLGRTLVSMISKWDRPDCRRQAFGVADALLKSHGGEPLELDYATASLDELNSDACVSHIKAALDAADIKLRDIRGYGWDLVDHARQSDNTEVVEILRRLEF